MIAMVYKTGRKWGSIDGRRGQLKDSYRNVHKIPLRRPGQWYWAREKGISDLKVTSVLTLGNTPCLNSLFCISLILPILLLSTFSV